jgi:chitinase
VDGVEDDTGPEADGLRGNFNQLRKLKAQHPHLKVMISIGRWTGSDEFTDIALSVDSRREFVGSCIELYFRSYPGLFDGVDVDWEFPVRGGLREGRPQDRQHFTFLLEEFRRQLDHQGQADGKGYLLTAATSARPQEYTNLELEKVVQHLDWINLMAYDFHISSEDKTNFNAPLFTYPNDPSAGPDVWEHYNSDAAVQGYLKAGVPPDKLVLGVPFYGRGWQGVPAANQGLFQPVNGPAQGAGEAGMFDYAEIVKDHLPFSQHYWHPDAKVPWLYRPDREVFISYDDPESLRQKAVYVKEHTLGGVMFWELSGDDRGGSLIEALRDGLQ